jgi:hypothetical protein
MPVPDFSPGEVLTAAAMDSIGLWKITSASATSGSVLNISNCFSSDYTNYRVTVTARTASAVGLNMQLRAAGSNLGTSGYYSTRVGYPYSGGGVSLANDNNAAQWQIAIIADTTESAGSIDIFNPQIAQRTTYACQGSDSRTPAGALGGFVSSGVYNANTVVDGISINCGANTFSNIVVTVYGYRK